MKQAGLALLQGAENLLDLARPRRNRVAQNLPVPDPSHASQGRLPGEDDILIWKWKGRLVIAAARDHQ